MAKVKGKAARPRVTGPAPLRYSVDRHVPAVVAPPVYVGMDVHNASIMMAVLPAGAPGATRLERVANEEAKVKRFFTHLAAEGVAIHACYEASGAGFVLQRWLAAWGHDCVVIAPSLTPRRPGEHRKHDKHDARELALLLRAGALVPVRIPDAALERIRDVVRCRHTFQRQVMRARHFILKFLARRDLPYRGQGRGQHWTLRHFAWLRQLLDDHTLPPEDAIVFGEYLALLQYVLGRRHELDGHVDALAASPRCAPAVNRLRAFRGVNTYAAMVLVTEIGDWTRFRTPRELAAYLGLIPRERSSGETERRGQLTKAGNAFCRHILVQAAWHYRARPQMYHSLRVRQRGQPAVVVAHAWKAQQRLYKRYHALASKRGTQIAVVAIARELAGFLWGVMRTLDVPPVALAPGRTAAIV